MTVAAATDVRLRAMEPEEWSEVADLIYVSLNYWCEANGRPAVFRGGPGSTRVFCEVYEALDPGHCVVAEHLGTGRLVGSCFYRARETHCSLGIMTGFARGEEQAAALLLAELNVNAGRTPVFLLPVEYDGLVERTYAWGARNCEIHFAQVLGEAAPFNGVTMPTFLPETA